MPDAISCPINGEHLGIPGTCLTCRKPKTPCRYCGADVMLSSAGIWMTLPHDCKQVNTIGFNKLGQPTGFESKSLKSVIQNWLYNSNMDIVVDASREMRRRFSKTWPCPEWLKTPNTQE